MSDSARRVRAGLGLGLAALLLVACDAGGSNPFASFAARCAQLPPSRLEVSAVPITYVQDESQSIDQLTVRSGHTPGRHLTFGLTTVNFGHQTQFEIRSVEDAAGARACGTLDIAVRLSMQPVTIYLARELDGSPCARTATLEHEMKHVAVFREVLDEAARDLAADLAGTIGSGLQRAASQAELQRQLNARVNDYLSEFMHRRKQAMDERQDGVDSPEEYARVKDACAQ
jgi:hypothetical protein